MTYTIDDFKDYIENLAKSHSKVKHSDTDIHFAYLNDQKESLLPDQMRYPFVYFGHEGFQVNDAGQMVWDVNLSLFDHVVDTGNDIEVNTALGTTCQVLIDFLSKMKEDRKSPSYKILRGLDFNEASASPMSNQDDALYGYAISFRIALPWCAKLADGTFLNS